MENQYYRKVTPMLGGWLSKTFRKRSVLLTVFAALPAFLFVMFSNKGVIQRLSLESQKNERLEKVRDAQKEQLRLYQQSRALDSDPRAIEKVAREKYGMIREGESVYKIRKDK